MRKLAIIMSTALALLALMACGAPTHTDVMTTPAEPDSALQMALDDAEVKIADLTAQLQEYERGERQVYDAGVAYSEPGFDQALVNCLNGMRVWPSEGAVTVSRAINSEYAEVIAQCTAVRYGSDGAPEESRWMLIRTAVSSMPESELGWVRWSAARSTRRKTRIRPSFLSNSARITVRAGAGLCASTERMRMGTCLCPRRAAGAPPCSRRTSSTRLLAASGYRERRRLNENAAGFGGIFYYSTVLRRGLRGTVRWYSTSGWPTTRQVMALCPSGRESIPRSLALSLVQTMKKPL